MIVSTATLPGLLEECFAADLVPFVIGPPAIGKALANREEVLTPSGFRAINTLKKSQWVIGSNGKPTQITGVFPQSGKRPIYEVICKDGSSILCDAEHKWTVNNRDWKESKVKTTQELMDAGLYNLERDTRRNTTNRRYKFSLPATPACEFDANQNLIYEIDPYLLGLLLGDGGLSQRNIKFTNAHEALINKVETLLPAHSCIGHKKFKQGAWHINVKNSIPWVAKTDAKVGNYLKYALQQIGLFDCKSVNKFIPHDYLYGSLQTRQAIYQGLIDTDGYVRNGNVHEYSTSSKQLANDFLFLARSMGKNFSISERESGYTKDGEFHQCGTSYRLHEFIGPAKLIKEINYIGEENATCISVAANDHLFIAGDFNLTHNSAIINQVAENHKLEVIDLRLSQSDPTDMNGFPMINDAKTKASFIPMETFPVKGDTPPSGKDGWLIFLDEMNSAPLGVQAAAFKLVLDRKVGQHDLHENVFICCAGNRAQDKGITNRISMPMQSRLAHFELEVDNKAWLKWAAAGIDFRIRSFIGFKPDLLYRFKPDHDGATYPSPRTWEFMSRLLKKYPGAIPAEKMPLLASVVEEAAAMEFWTYSKIFQSLLTEQQIMNDPTGVKIPEEPSIQFALAGSLGQKMTTSNAKPLMTFIQRMPIEMQVLCMQGACRRDGSLMAQKDIDTWFNQYSKDLF